MYQGVFQRNCDVLAVTHDFNRQCSLSFRQSLAGQEVFLKFETLVQPLPEEKEDWPIPAISVTLPMEVAQHLVDALWDAGLKPSNPKIRAAPTSNPDLDAINGHIADLREIVRKLLDHITKSPPTLICGPDNSPPEIGDSGRRTWP